MKTLLLTGASLAAFCLPAFAHAQEAPAPSVASVTEVGEITVANRSPATVEKIGASVTVLATEDIRERQAPLVSELLAQTPGVNITRNGGPGTTSAVHIRGAEGHHTVVLIDGVKLNDPSSTQGGFNFGNLLVGDIERIEVLRGAQSTLWGSQAIGGVVNIVTAQPRDGLHADGSAEAGERGSSYVRLGVDGANDRAGLRIAGGVFRTDGFSAYAPGAEADGYRNEGLAARGFLNLTDTAALDLRAVYSDGRHEFDAFNRDSAEFGTTEEFVAYAGVNLAVLDGRWKNRVAVAVTDTDRANFNPALPGGVSFAAEGRNERIEYQGSFAVRDGWSATFGAESEEAEYHIAPDAFGTPAQDAAAGIDSFYGQLQVEAAPGLTLTGGLRYDDHDTFGDQTLGQAALAWVLNDGATVLRASFGQGFRAPGLFELFSEFGNPSLEPEAVDSYDAGVAQRLWDGRVLLAATWFHREAENEINFFSCTGAPDPLCTVNGVPRFGYYQNIQAAEADGWELSGEYRPTERFTLAANWTITKAEFASGPNVGNQLIRRPREMGNLIAAYRWPIDLTTSAQVRYVGEVFANPANTTRLAPYTLVDFRASYPVNDQIEVFGRIENAFDEDYQTVPNFGTPPRGVFAGVRARF